ncbi:beta-ketoacyl-ACP synthase III [Streptomyces sp. NBC_01803]|uniref:beta-ketoacyl-ACP synthase III n=1 Tax=Streptomyces sp. NBC_01803 TaxID=2975946 RepID=UPI002DD85F52|nr:beta-ketoacyl-ACP synthase III [Streptomyces sp. NBC_01803]WSA46130.1 ketoacyl-ACP synthase III [Streptomyces sp. NBC_01803]
MKARITPAPRPAAVGSPHARILGVGGYRPRRVVTNDEVCERIDSNDEWIRTRTGIVTRAWAGPDETLADMAVSASGKALAAAGITADALDCVIVATFTHLWQTPAVATEIAHRLGAHTAAAFDISAGCAGFVHALALAADTVRGRGGHVLVIGAERMSDLLDLDDRSTAVIFGDGAGAAVVGPSSTPAIGPVIWGADGSQADAVTQTVPWDALRDDRDLRWPALTQKGQQVFRWAVYEISKVARQALDAAGVTVDDLDVFIPHQANVRIIDAMARNLGLPDTTVIARDVTTSGNTSGASIPLAMDALLASNEVSPGDLALLIGFGAGLSYAATVVALP